MTPPSPSARCQTPNDSFACAFLQTSFPSSLAVPPLFHSLTPRSGFSPGAQLAASRSSGPASVLSAVLWLSLHPLSQPPASEASVPPSLPPGRSLHTLAPHVSGFLCSSAAPDTFLQSPRNEVEAGSTPKGGSAMIPASAAVISATTRLRRNLSGVFYIPSPTASLQFPFELIPADFYCVAGRLTLAP